MTCDDDAGARPPARRRRFARRDDLLVYERVLPAVPASVTRVRHELGGTLSGLGVSATRAATIALVVSEAATNVVLHAYVGGPPGPLVVAAALSDRDLLLHVSDTGPGLVSRDDSPGIGCGLPLMRSCADALDVTTAGGTHVRALFRQATEPGVAGRVVARPDRMLVHEYVEAVAATSACLQDDTRALLAEARQALKHSKRQREERRSGVALRT